MLSMNGIVLTVTAYVLAVNTKQIHSFFRSQIWWIPNAYLEDWCLLQLYLVISMQSHSNLEI